MEKSSARSCVGRREKRCIARGGALGQYTRILNRSGLLYSIRASCALQINYAADMGIAKWKKHSEKKKIYICSLNNFYKQEGARTAYRIGIRHIRA